MAEKIATWEELDLNISNCSGCGLRKGCKGPVTGRGSRTAKVLFVGEGPGEQEDEQGLPFVGPAGKLLDLALEALAFPPDSYYIANVVKCRPPNNREPLEEEAGACLPFLRAQFKLIKPSIIVCLGKSAAQAIISRDIAITAARGRWVERKGWLIMPTFHPAALLRDPSKKWPFYEDLRAVREKLLDTGREGEAGR